MATIDKLTLEFEASGVDNFIRKMKDTDSALATASNKILGVEKDYKRMDKSINKSDKSTAKIKDKINKTNNKQSKQQQRNYKEQYTALSKLLKTMVAFSGIGFTLSAIQQSSDKATSQVTSLGNETRNMMIPAKELEGVRQALKLSGQNANELDGLIGMISNNLALVKSGKGVDSDLLNLVGYLNGADNSGNKIDPYSGDVLSILNSFEKMFKSNSEDWRKSITGELARAGINGLTAAGASFLSDDDYKKNIRKGQSQAIADDSLLKQAKGQKEQLEAVNKEYDNVVTQAGLKWTGANVKLTKIYTELAKNSAILAPMVEDALDLVNVLVKGVSKGIDSLFGKDGIYTTQKKETLEYLNNVEKKQDKAEGQKAEILKSYDDKIESINTKHGFIKFKGDDGNFDGGFFDSLKYSPYIYDHLKSILDKALAEPEKDVSLSYNPETLKELSDQAIISNEVMNSTANNNPTSININEMKVITNDDNIERIIKNGFEDSKIAIMSGGRAMTFMHNIG